MSHAYIYDDFLNNGKYEKYTRAIEARITDLGLNGKTIKTGSAQTLPSAVASEVKKGTKTIILIGNDLTLSKAVNQLAGTAAAVAIVPIGRDHNQIAEVLGISDHLSACEILASRMIQEMDLGQANGVYFLRQARIESEGTDLRINSQYTVQAPDEGTICFCNLPPAKDNGQNSRISPVDNRLDLLINATLSSGRVIKKKTETLSHLYFDRVLVNNPRRSLILDDIIQIKTPAAISLAEKKINLIVGRNRKF